MKKLQKPSASRGRQKNAFRGGAYSLAFTAMLVAVLILVNILVAVLPSSMTKYDISAAKLYSVTSNTKNVVSNLSQDVTIYWIAQPDAEDEIIRNLLERYEALSDHIKVLKRNPDVYPAFAQQYTDEPVQNNSLVVESGDRSRYIGYDDIYLTQPDMSSYSYSASFDGEGAITSAIDYVVNAEQPVIYQLEGHGELELPQVFLDQLEKSNMEVRSLSLLNTPEIPEDCDALMIHGPSSDLSEEDVKMLKAYVEAGGKLLVMAGPTVDGMLPNLYSLLEQYGVSTLEGVILEDDRAHYAFRTPYVLLPRIHSHPITDPLLEEHYYPILPVAQAMTVESVSPESGITELLETSSVSFSKPEGYQLETYEREEGDTGGPFTVGVNIDVGEEGQLTWFSSSGLLDPVYNAYSSGANLDLVMNTLTDMVGESESMAIRSKSLNYNYLTISESTASMLKVLLIGVFPLTYLGIGIVVVVRKRKEYRREAV